MNFFFFLTSMKRKNYDLFKTVHCFQRKSKITSGFMTNCLANLCSITTNARKSELFEIIIRSLLYCIVKTKIDDLLYNLLFLTRLSDANVVIYKDRISVITAAGTLRSFNPY